MLKAQKIRCSACLKSTSNYYFHELLSVPVCEECNQTYYLGSFPVDAMTGNEIYCRWCGQGESTLMLCDSCPKSFCERCIRNNFGLEQAEQLKNSKIRWHCFLCDTKPVTDLIKTKSWDNIDFLPAQCFSSIEAQSSLHQEEELQQNNVICPDIARGREKFAIPAINECDDEEVPLDFVYITRPVASHGVVLTNNPNSLICCTCEDNCRDGNKCECAIASGGPAYSRDGRLLEVERDGSLYVYECNYKCRCDRRVCKNRVVSNGPTQKLEVFRCENPRKGWGVRCRTDIAAGTFIADYVGEILPEAAVEKRGLEKSDEYLYNMDAWSRARAHSLNVSLGLSESLDMIPREQIVDSSLLDEKGLEQYFDASFIEKLSSSGAIRRAQEKGKKKRKFREETLNSGYPDHRRSWYEEYLGDFKQEWESGIISFTDRTILEADTLGKAFSIDARWFGSVGRFLNHSCNPNLSIVQVFCESQNPLMPRIAFFAEDMIPARTELCYDYHYCEGDVAGKQRDCLCGSDRCRKTFY